MRGYNVMHRSRLQRTQVPTKIPNSLTGLTTEALLARKEQAVVNPQTDTDLPALDMV
jgi:hypothetical protein